MKKFKTYSELIKIPDFLGRYNYLKLNSKIGSETFGFERYLNQKFYSSSKEWADIRRQIIIRDMGNDMGLDGFTIFGSIYVHHMNPITTQDILNATEFLTNPEYLICVSQKTHNAIHFGNEQTLGPVEPLVRKPNDTTPWK